MAAIKVVFDQEIHTFKGEMRSFSELLTYIAKSFRQLPQAFNLYYLDTENDQITLSCEEDFSALLENSKSPKIYIQRAHADGQLISLKELKQSRIVQRSDQIFIEVPSSLLLNVSASAASSDFSQNNVSQASAVLPSFWECKLCTFYNGVGETKCNMCDWARGSEIPQKP
jgi:hypothetical protein